MTSKISYSKLIRNEMRQMTWLTAIWGLVFGLLIPFRVLMVMSVAASNADQWPRQRILDIFYAQVGLGRFENFVFILLAGAACALCAFSYLHSAVKLDLYHSLALKRERLFGVRYVSSAMTFGSAYLVSQILAILIGAFYGVLSWQLLFEMAAASLEGILVFLCSYSAVLLSIMLTGKMLTTIFAVGVFAGYIPMIWLLVVGMKSVFLTAKLDSYSVVETEILKCSSPWAFSLSHILAGRIGLTGNIPSLGWMCQLLALAAALTAASLLLYRIRKTEAAGNALAFAKTEGIIKLMLCVPVSIFSALIANELFSSVVWEIIFLLLFGTLSCMIIEFIYRWDIRMVFKKRGYLAANFVIAAVLFFSVRFDVMGYNTYLPAKDELAAMSVQETRFNIHYPEVSKYRSSINYKKAVLDYLETDDFDGLYQLAESGVQNLEKNINGRSTCISLKYHTKSGKEVYRMYPVEEELYLDVMDDLMQNKEFREKYFPVLTWDEEDISKNAIQAGVYMTEILQRRQLFRQGFSDTDEGLEGTRNTVSADDMEDEEIGNIIENEALTERAAYQTDEYVYIDVPVADRERLIEAYCKDLEQASWRDIWLAESYLRFTTDQVSWQTDLYPLKDTFENTLKVLSEIHQSGQSM